VGLRPRQRTPSTWLVPKRTMVPSFCGVSLLLRGERLPVAAGDGAIKNVPLCRDVRIPYGPISSSPANAGFFLLSSQIGAAVGLRGRRLS
jgi:hypothetical protein